MEILEKEVINKPELELFINSKFSEELVLEDVTEIKIGLMEKRRILLIFMRGLSEMNMINEALYKEITDFIITRYIYFKSVI